MWFISHHEIGWGLICDRVGLVIVCELGKGDVLGPGCGIRSTEDPEVGLDFLVDAFSFAISLRMVSGGEGEFIAKEFSQFLGEG